MEENKYFVLPFPYKEKEDFYKTLEKSKLKEFLKDRNLNYSFSDSKSTLIYHLLEDDLKKFKLYLKDYKKSHIEACKYDLRQGKQSLPETYEGSGESHLDVTLEYIRTQKQENGLKYILKTNPIFKTEFPGNFPDNISHIYWVYQIEAEDNMENNYDFRNEIFLLCKLDNGNYAYLAAIDTSGDYTCCIGDNDVKLYVTKNPEDLIKYAMASREYYYYFKNTKPIKN